jgi:hypothetical protein
VFSSAHHRSQPSEKPLRDQGFRACSPKALLLIEDQFTLWLTGEAGTEMLRPTPNDYLLRRPVSRRVNSSKANADDPTLIDRIQLVSGRARVGVDVPVRVDQP